MRMGTASPIYQRNCCYWVEAAAGFRNATFMVATYYGWESEDEVYA
jgi:hypothetical protein